MQDKQVVELEAEHVRKIVERNLREGIASPRGVSVEEITQAYTSVGSVGYCLLAEGVPVAAAGIVNLQWQRGEAWLLHSSLFDVHKKTSFRLLKEMLPALARIHGFRRVQATCFGASAVLFKHLGFEREGNLRAFGPAGEDAVIYSRIFDGLENV